MYKCLYTTSNPQGCPNERTIDYDFCNEHMNTPRGRQHAMDIIAQKRLTVPSDIEAVVRQAQEIPEKDAQTTILEAAGQAIQRILDWEEESRIRLHQIPQEDWRYTSRDGSEQARTELKTYETAMRQTVTSLKDVSKIAIAEKMVSLGKAQSEMMVRILNAVVNDLGLPSDQIDRARYSLLAHLRSEANLNKRVESSVAKQLTGGEGGGD